MVNTKIILTIILWNLTLFCVSGCHANSSNTQKTTIPETSQEISQPIVGGTRKETQMTLDYTPYLALTMPWGEGKNSIPHTTYPKTRLSGMLMPTPPRMIRPVYGIRIDNNENVYLLFNLPQNESSSNGKYRVTEFSPQGNIIHQVEFAVDAPDVSTWQVLDFSPDNQGGLYLLEILRNQQGLLYRLRRLNKAGQTMWANMAPFDQKTLDFEQFKGKFEYLLALNSGSLYLPSRYPHQGLAKLDPADGNILATYQWDESFDKLVLTDAGEAYYSRLLEDSAGKRHVLIRRSLVDGSRQIIESDIQFLHDLAGIDAEGNIYPRIHEGIVQLSPQGQVKWEQHVYGIVVKTDEAKVFICDQILQNSDSLMLDVSEYQFDGAQNKKFTFQLSQEKLPIQSQVPYLIHVDSDLRFYFHTGETDEQGGTVFIYDANGALQETLSFNETGDSDVSVFDEVNQQLLPIESRVGAPSMFQIDRSGNIYIPLSDPEGFKVIRLQQAMP